MKKIDRDWLLEWTFKKRHNTFLAHKIHRYPAVFIPELAEKIIKLFSERDDTVLDIFSGSGTSLLASMGLERHSIGIELNPLGVLIANVKTTAIEKEKAYPVIADWKNQFLNNTYKPLDFHNMDFWYSQETLKSLSDMVGSIEEIEADDIRNLIKISLSEILREISYCNHGGFKQHRSKAKIAKGMHFTKIELLDKLLPILERNIKAVDEIKDINTAYQPTIIFSDSRYHQEIIPTVDLIITSPPYGDSHTTVAYGQFSALSSQILGLKSLDDYPIRQLDNKLLGGSVNGVDINKLSFKSITLSNVAELFISRAELSKTDVEKKRTHKRLKDILAFYEDLERCLKHGSSYLKKDGFFVLVTASRIVHNTKLHTDIIIAELCINYNLKLKNIYYRDIHNKRIPSKVSASNIKGDKSPTMTQESIIVLQKV